MADPFSIVATVIGLTGTAIKVSRLIYEFTKDLGEAWGALIALSNEISLLRTVFDRLERSLKEDFDSVPPFPTDMSRELGDVLNSCMNVLQELERIVIKFIEKKRKGGLRDIQNRVRWVFEEKNISRIRVSLEAHKETLNITLMFTLNWNTSQINKDTKQLLRLVDKLLVQNVNQVAEIKQTNPNPKLKTHSKKPPSYSETEVLVYHIDEAVQPPSDTTIVLDRSEANMVATMGGGPQHELVRKDDVAKFEVTNNENKFKSLESIDPSNRDLPNVTDRGNETSKKDEPIELIVDRRKVIEGDDIPEVITSSEESLANDETSVEDNEEDASADTSEAVRIAVETGNLEMVLLLLEFAGKVNVNDFNYAAALESAVDPNFASPLLAAIRYGKVDMAEILVSHGADIKQEDALTRAVQSRTPRMVELLVKAGADVETKGPWGNNQLILAMQNEDIETLKVLLDHGADINGTGEYGNTALTVAISRRSIPIMQLLLNRGADANIDNAFKKAAQYDNGPELLKVLIDAGSKGVSSQPYIATAAYAGNSKSIIMEIGGNPPIIYAVKSRKLDALKTLLDLGADINATGEYGNTALTVAIAGDNVDMIQHLVLRGADATIDNAVEKAARRSAGHTYLKILRDGGAEGFLSQSCVAAAAEAGNEKSITLLLDAGADIEAKGAWGNGPLNFAAGSDRVGVMRLLLDRGADIDAPGEYGKTGLVSAIEKDSLDMVKLLIERGADLKGAFLAAARRNEGHRIIKIMLDAGARVPAEDSGIGAAAQIGNLKSLTMLLDGGANIEERDGWGNSPLIIAVSFSQMAATKILLQRGADVNVSGSRQRTALQLAFEQNTVETAELLLSEGIELQAWKTCLEEALQQKNNQHIHLLMRSITDEDIVQDTKGTMLQLAIKCHRYDILTELISRGADAKAPGLIQAAVRSGDTVAVGQLLDAGVDINAVHAGEGGSLLQVAAAAGQEIMLKFLFERGLDIKAPGCSIGPALTSALKGRHNEVAKLLMIKSKQMNK
ncbi:ankyrin repeat-containing domain protein [Xylogone sp. PMI_703]|nr:ankyrin repeat-containing domain protein [Xylogone sp. PMI_703]